MPARIGIFGLSGCWGDQLVLLDCEDELPRLLPSVELVDFLAAERSGDSEGPLDIALVEGSVGSARDEARLQEIRARARILVACGTCACFGGIAAAQTVRPRAELCREIYGPLADGYDLAPHRPLHRVVPVDASLPGCPIEKHELLAALASLLGGSPPASTDHAVCMDCRIKENSCLLLTGGLPCVGPVTLGGCRARCPSLGAPCIGCRGPIPDANLASIESVLTAYQVPADRARRLLTLFAPVEEVRR
jgi:coenzyme F420-reducing hydrogenase gamma subunit